GPSGCRRTSASRPGATPGWPRARATWCCSSTTTAGTPTPGWPSTSPAGSPPAPGLPAPLAGRFAADPSLAVLSMQVVDPDGGPGARWHVPRLRAGDPERSSVVTTFLGGACAIRRSAYLEAGGLPDLFFYGHEETDLAWRLMDRGYRLEYDATARMCHHSLPNARH